MNNLQQLDQKIWKYCLIFRDDGLSCGDHVTHLTTFSFCGTADGQTRPLFTQHGPILGGFGRDVLIRRDGDDPETYHRHTLEDLGERNGSSLKIKRSLKKPDARKKTTSGYQADGIKGL